MCSAGKAFPISPLLQLLVKNIHYMTRSTISRAKTHRAGGWWFNSMVGETFFPINLDKFVLIFFPVLQPEIVFNFRFLFIFFLVSCV